MTKTEFWKVTIKTHVTWTKWFTSRPTLGDLESALMADGAALWPSILELVRYVIPISGGHSAGRVKTEAIIIAGQQIGTFVCMKQAALNNDTDS